MRYALENTRQLSLTPNSGTTSLKPALGCGPKGEDGSNVLPTDEAVENALEARGLPTSGADLSALIAPKLDALPELKPAQGVLVLTFDDGPQQDVTIVKPLLDGLGVKGTFFPYVAAVGQGTNPGWSTWRSFVADGHEVGCHSYTHADLSAANAATLHHEIDDALAAFKANGVAPAGYCWPFSAHSAAARKAVRQAGFKWALGGTGGSTQPLHTFALKRVGVAGNNAAIEAQVDAAMTAGEVLCILIHAADSGFNAGAQANLTHLIEYAQSVDMPIVTASQAFALVGNLLDVGDLPGSANYSVVDGSGKMYADAATPRASTSILLPASTAPSAYPANMVSYLTVSAAEASWPGGAAAGQVITDRTEASNWAFVLQTYSSNGRIWQRRASSSSAWGSWTEVGGSPIVVGSILTGDVSTAPLPNQYASGKESRQAVGAGGGATGWPEAGTPANLITDRTVTDDIAFTYQRYIPQSGLQRIRRATSATAWGSWVTVTPTAPVVAGTILTGAMSAAPTPSQYASGRETRQAINTLATGWPVAATAAVLITDRVVTDGITWTYQIYRATTGVTRIRWAVDGSTWGSWLTPS